MPRPKKKPAKSGDLTPMNEGILEGVHYDPFEPTVYKIEGLVPEFVSLGSLAELVQGPDLLDGQIFKVENPEDKEALYTVTLVTDNLLAQMQLSNRAKREYVQAQSKDGRLWLSFSLAAKESKTFKLLGSTYGGPVEIRGQLTIEGKFDV